MNSEVLFEEVGFTYEYRSESEAFYRPFFDTESDMIAFFCSVFQNDSTDKRPRWMMNDIKRFVMLARDVDQIRPGRDPLRILFFRICMEALCKDSASSKKAFWETFDSFFSEAGRQYILTHFVFSGIDTPDELTGIERVLFDSHEGYQLTGSDLMGIIKATRNMVVHDGDYWSVQFFARDREFTWLTSITTDEQIISCQPKGKELTYHFQTTMQYEKFEFFFVEACIACLKGYIKKQQRERVNET